MNGLYPTKMKKPKPRMYMDEQDLPAVKDWDVGKTYDVSAKIKMVSKQEGNEYESEYGMDSQSDSPKMRVTFKILDIKPTGLSKKKPGKRMPRVKPN